MYLYSFWKRVSKSQEQECGSRIFHLEEAMENFQFLNMGETSYFGTIGCLFFYIITDVKTEYQTRSYVLCKSEFYFDTYI